MPGPIPPTPSSRHPLARPILELVVPGALALVALAPDASRAGSLAFTSRFETHRTQVTPQDWVAGDFDEDGNVDLALVSGAGLNSVSLMRGDGARWTLSASLPVGLTPQALAVADLDGDGHLDLVTANRGSSNASVLRGNGDGTFAPRVHHATASGPGSLAIGDVTGDGIPDLVVASSVSATVSVLPGTGGAAFAPRLDRATGADLRAVRLHDLDADGLEDVILASASGNALMIHRSLGAGQLDEPQVLGGLAGPVDFDLADFDGDGRMDLVVAQSGAAALAHLRGGPGFQFEAPLPIALPGPAVAVAAGPAGLDADIDLAVVRGSTLDFLRGAGDGSFVPAQSIAAGNGARRPRIVQLAGAPPAEIGLAIAGTMARFSVHTVGPEGRIGTVAPGDEFEPATDLHVLDFDDDGQLDLVQLAAGALQTRRGLGNGAFAAPVTLATSMDPQYPNGFMPGEVAVADLNGDGRQDIVGVRLIAGEWLPMAFLGNGTAANGGFTTPAGALGTRIISPDVVNVGDANGDGRPDILVGSSWSQTPLVILFQQPGGSFTRTEFYFTAPQGWASSVWRAATTDVDGNGTIDVLVSTPDGVACLPGPVGPGGASGPAAFMPGLTGMDSRTIRFVDMDADGWMDLSGANGSALTCNTYGGTGAPGFMLAASLELVGTPASGIRAIDLDADGALDLVAPSREANGLSLFRSRGDGTFEPARHLGSNTTPLTVAAGDLDGDGLPELLAGGSTSTVVLHNLTALVDVGPPAPPAGVALALSAPVPNPTRGVMRLDLTMPDGRPAWFLVVDLRGRIVHRQELAAGNAGARRIEVALPSHLRPGLYFGRLQHPAGSRSTKIVLQR